MKPKIKDVRKIARSLGIRDAELELRGPYTAKINLSILERLRRRRRPSMYVLVSCMTPTPLGEGKTVTTIGLSMALNKLGMRSICTLRQSSLGPLFGAKGTATGGGGCQLLPTDDINLHFTGDTHAVGAANNLLAAFLENSIFHGNPLKIQPDSMTFKRCVDISDRSLRHIRYVLRSGQERYEIKTGFEITAASEVMSILTLSRDFADMRKRLGEIVVAENSGGECVKAKDLKAEGMMAAILKNAIKPNLVQTSEQTPCFIHAGPFANVSIGANSIIADEIALGLCDCVVTESGFGADCGAEKFFDIKCRASGLEPDICVLVASVRGIKAQSRKFNLKPGVKVDPKIFAEDQEALEQGILNLKKQIENIRLFGIPVVVCLNAFATDTGSEVEFVRTRSLAYGANACLISSCWLEGSKGALGLAKGVLKYSRDSLSKFKCLYDEKASIKEKIETVAKKVYGAAQVEYSSEVLKRIDFCEKKDYARLPVCIAKTQFSLSHDQALKGAPSGFTLPIKDLKLNSGAGFIVAYASLMQTMPGLPPAPRGEHVKVNDTADIRGLF